MANVLKSNAVARQLDVRESVAKESISEQSFVGAAVSRLSGLAGFNLSDLADEGRKGLDESQRHADQILADARLEAESIRSEAKQRGYQDGLDQAVIDNEARVQSAAIERSQSGLDLVQSALDQLHNTHQRWMNEYAHSLTTIALSATQRIVSRELTLDPQLIVAWAKQAVHSARSACRLTVAVHPETLAQIGPALDQMLASPDLPEQTFVEPDDSVGPGEVVVRQAGGEIHAGLMAQLQRLEELLV